MWANFISHCDEGAIFHNSRSELFHIRRKPNISLKACDSEVFRNFVDAFRAFRVCRQIRTTESLPPVVSIACGKLGGTRSVTEGACATLKSDETLLQRALPQSPTAPAPSRREPLRESLIKHLKCLQNCGIIKPRKAVNPI